MGGVFGWDKLVEIKLNLTHIIIAALMLLVVDMALDHLDEINKREVEACIKLNCAGVQVKR